MATPRWSLNEELLAYSTRGSIENQDAFADRNIYAYDRVNERVEPICISTEDDIDPAWSPSDSNLIAFSRAEGKHRQIWLIEFNMEVFSFANFKETLSIKLIASGYVIILKI